MQVAFQLEYSILQPLLKCSVVPVRILTKCIFAFLAKYRDLPNILQHISLQNKEVAFISSCLTCSLRSRNTLLFSTTEDILHSLQILTSYPCDIKSCAYPNLLDGLLSTDSCDDRTITELTLKILWNLSSDPTVALAILNHENAIYLVQKFKSYSSLAGLSTSVLWTLGQSHGKVQSKPMHCMQILLCIKLFHGHACRC